VTGGSTTTTAGLAGVSETVEVITEPDGSVAAPPTPRRR
jgi:hypothetical protein